MLVIIGNRIVDKEDRRLVLAPIPGENPAGDDLRYNPLYDEIKEARKTEDSLSLGDWKRDVKTANWDKVITIALETLTKKTKDLQRALPKSLEGYKVELEETGNIRPMSR